jgi:amino-acid N-acetyltransferase
MQRLSDLREILHYVPQFRDRVFVLAIDGAVVAEENAANVWLDVALLRSLRIGVAIVHGAGLQVRQLASRLGTKLSNSDGIGITDAPTLQISLSASNKVTQEIIVGLAANDLRAASGNFLISHPAGILGGVDHQFTGKVERVDTTMLQSMMAADIIPVVAPIGTDGENHTYRLNSDAVAVEVARALGAVKLIYLSAHQPPKMNSKLMRQVNPDDALGILKKQKQDISPVESHSKLENAVRAVKLGVPRVHIVDGRVPEALLAEVFSNEGIGTLIHANEYQSIRRAMKKDLRGLYALIQRGMEADELLKRTRAEIERHIEDYFVFEVDKTPVACGALHVYVNEDMAELSSLYVDHRYENQGIGVKLIRYGEELARQMKVAELFCLSTQAINYFVQKAGFRLGTPDELPPSRREVYERNGRKSQVLLKRLG